MLTWLQRANRQHNNVHCNPDSLLCNNMLRPDRKHSKRFVSEHYHNAHGWRKLFPLFCTCPCDFSSSHKAAQSCLNTESVWQLKTQLLFSGPSVTMSARVFFLCWYELSIVLLFRWAGGTWGCLASPLKRPPTWMPWLLRGCCFLTSTPQTHSAPHVSQQNALEYRTIHFIFTAFFLYLCCHRHNNEMLE